MMAIIIYFQYFYKIAFLANDDENLMTFVIIIKRLHNYTCILHNYTSTIGISENPQ